MSQQQKEHLFEIPLEEVHHKEAKKMCVSTKHKKHVSLCEDLTAKICGTFVRNSKLNEKSFQQMLTEEISREITERKFPAKT